MKILEENDCLRFWEEDHIICYTYKQPVVDLKIAKDSVLMRYRVTNNQPCLVFGDLENVKSVTREARDYYTCEDAENLVTAAAVLTPTIITKIIATFFLNFNKPKVPFKMFSSKEKAFEWLLEFKDRIN
jgi:hypothetical protein